MSSDDFHPGLGARSKHPDLVSRAEGLGRDLSAIEERLSKLETRYDELRMVNLALWGLLKESLKATDADLIDRILKLEAACAKRGGRYVREPRTCAACSRAVPEEKPTCMYCGAALQRATPFQGT